MRPSRSLLVLTGFGVILVANYLGYRSWYAKPLAEKLGQAQQIESRIDSVRSRTEQLLVSRADIQPIAARTLARTGQTAEERLRFTLNDIVRAIELEGVRVDTRVDANPTVNPASTARLNAFRLRDERGRLRHTPVAGYNRITASISGSGPTDRVMRLVATLESQNWLLRLTRVRLVPQDLGRRTDFAVDLETIFLPARSPAEGPGQSPADQHRLTLASSILDRSPFSPPPPPRPVRRDPPREVVQAPPPEAPAPPPPYDQWRVAFLREGSSGPELTIRQVNSSESRVLAVGGQFHGMIFHGFVGLDAIFEFDGERYRIGVGQNLASRDKVDPVR